MTDTKYPKKLSFYKMLFLQIIKELSNESPDIKNINKILINWKILNSLNLNKVFVHTFIPIFLRFSNFSTIQIYMEEINNNLNITKVKLMEIFSICFGLFKSIEITKKYDNEAFYFYLINNDSTINLNQKEKDLFIKDVKNFLNNESNNLNLNLEEQEELSLFLSGLFKKIDKKTIELDKSITEFIKHTLDNFLWLITEYKK